MLQITGAAMQKEREIDASMVGSTYRLVVFEDFSQQIEIIINIIN